MSSSTVSSFDGQERKSKGAVLFTGPDGIGDFNVRVEEQFFVGHGSMSPEASSDTQYLYRAASNCPHPPPKTARVGEIGWGVPKLSDNALLKSGQQIMLKEFRQATEDRHTHLYQNPYYPPQSNTPSQYTNRTDEMITGGEQTDTSKDKQMTTQPESSQNSSKQSLLDTK